MRNRLGVLCGLLGGIVLFGVPPLPAAGPHFKQAAPAAKPATHKVEKGPFRLEVTAKGVFEAEEMTEVVLRPDVWTSLPVLKAVEHGVAVKKGDTILTLDPEKIDRAIKDLEADRYLNDLAFKQAEDELALLEKSTPLDLAAAELAKKYADEDLKRYQEIDRAMMEKTAQFMLKFATNGLEYAKEELHQLEKMYKAKDLTEGTEEIILRRQRNRVEAAQFQVTTAEQQRDQTLKVDMPRRDHAVQEAAQKQAINLEKAKLTLPTTVTQKRLALDKMKYERSKAAEKFKQHLKDRELFTVKSPADGIVYYGKCSRGQWTAVAAMADKLRRGGAVMPEEVIFTIVKPRPLFIRTALEEKDLQYVKAGIAGKATATAFPDAKLSVSVTEVSSVPLAAGSFEAKLKVTGKEPESLAAGMACTLKLTVYQKDDALTIPVAAVFNDEGDEDHPYVYLAAKDGKSEKRAVTVGHKTDKRAEITQGLQAGDEVLTEKPEAKKGTP